MMTCRSKPFRGLTEAQARQLSVLINKAKMSCDRRDNKTQNRLSKMLVMMTKAHKKHEKSVSREVESRGHVIYQNEEINGK